MKKIILILCTPLFLLAQTDGNKHSIEWNTNLLFESSSLDKSFLNTMLYGGYITDSMKTKWINTGGDNNVLYSATHTNVSVNEAMSMIEDVGVSNDINSNVVENEVIDRDEAIKRIKEAKDLFDTGILSQEEYDKLMAKYKPIIIGN